MLFPITLLSQMLLLFFVFLLMELNFLIDNELSLEEAVLMPLLSLSLVALPLLQLRQFFDGQCIEEDNDDEVVGDEGDDNDCDVDDDDNEKNEKQEDNDVGS